ncbi:hypothetical protein FRX31_007930 [Thalictrum thalictroides]|uniref:Uncharacterized protein n=1 Tax=Thalictrum thalictroides TaxID=46969 RepID=A0A7J6WZJ6_THATH|nr:hypothetical protein FRX31_007930 [Thalictrum thalictroides]
MDSTLLDTLTVQKLIFANNQQRTNLFTLQNLGLQVWTKSCIYTPDAQRRQGIPRTNPEFKAVAVEMRDFLKDNATNLFWRSKLLLEEAKS